MKRLICILTVISVLLSGCHYISDNEIEERQQAFEAAETYRSRYETLSQTDKQAYVLVYDALINYEKEIPKLPKEFDPKHLHDVFMCVLDDNPEIFWIDETGITTNSMFKYDDGKVRIFYSMSAKTAKEKLLAVEAAVSEFVAEHQNDSEYDKALAVYEYVTTQAEYDNGYFTATYNHDSAIYSVFLNHKALCVGYAKAVSYLMNKLGMRCDYIDGQADGGGHAWNIAYIDGEPYYIDSTWGDMDRDDSFTYAYFCFKTDELNTHIPSEKYSAPECVADSASYYVKNGAYFETYDYNAILDVVCKAVADGDKFIEIKFSNEEALDEAVSKLIDSEKIFSILKKAKKGNSALDRNNLSYSVLDDMKVFRLYPEYK